VTALEAEGLGKRFGKRWALRHCSLTVPAGRVVGLVGANGAGKTTLLHLAVGLLEPTEGAIRVLGRPPAHDVEQLARVGFLAQDAPVYGSLSVADHLELGRRLNPSWDRQLAERRIGRLGLPLDQRAGKLSGGQRSQLALTLAMGKRPELLLLDEPVSSLDPLARREFMQDLMELVAEREPTVVLSSHLLSDIERICDHLIVVAGGRVRVDGPVDDLLATHKLLTGPRADTTSLGQRHDIVRVSHTDRQTTVLVRTKQPIIDPRWVASDVGLEDLVLAYMAAAPDSARVELAAVPT
jgi:ABC-2 type transport system ATP-binding protein